MNTTGAEEKDSLSECPSALRHMRALCSLLGNPERGLRIIHVAGTNGKGSVCRYIYESLRAFGYTVGIFTSPYVRDIRERIEADGKLISARRLETLTARVLAAAGTLAERYDLAGCVKACHPQTGYPPFDGSPTEFEIMTAVGFLFFAEERPDFVVLEAGLGGRGDATNVIEDPLVTVITRIALDHTDRLGDTIEGIAWEKAGIIKEGRPVVTGAVGTAAMVVAKVAAEKNAQIIDASKIGYRVARDSLGGCSFDARLRDRPLLEIELAMPGKHQAQNAVTALCVLDTLYEQGVIRGSEEALRRGLKLARLEARVQVISTNPLVIVDGTHNPDGARALTQALDSFFPNGRLLFVCSLMNDKAARDMVGVLRKSASDFIAAGSSHERSLSAAALARIIRAEEGAVLCEADLLGEAFEAALRCAEDYDAVVFVGSLYTAGDVLQKATRVTTAPSTPL